MPSFIFLLRDLESFTTMGHMKLVVGVHEELSYYSCLLVCFIPDILDKYDSV